VINRPLAFLDSNRELRQLAEKVQQLKKLQQQYTQLAPAALLLNSRVLSVNQTQLTIAADNGVTAAKLRHSSQDLIELFQMKGFNLTSIQIKVQPDVTPPFEVVTPRLISQTARQELTNLAGCLKDSPLKSSLQRLALKSKIGK